MIIKSISIKEQKQDRNGKWYRPCVAEFEGESGSYWHNIYLSTDVVNNWLAGDEVQAKLKNDGKWKNFDPIISKDASALPQNRPVSPVPPKDEAQTDSDIYTILGQINAKIDGLPARIEKLLDDRTNEGKSPF